MGEVKFPLMTRRQTLLAVAAAAGCGKRKATRFSGYCFVANQGGRNIAAVDLSRFALRRQIALDAAPSLVAAHPDASVPHAYALAADGCSIYEISAQSLEIKRRVRLGGQAAGMLASPKGDAFWLALREPSALVELRLDTLKPGRRIALGAPPDSFALSEDGRAVAASRQGRSLTVVSLSRGAVERTLPLSGEPGPVAFRRDGKQILAGLPASKSLLFLDTANGKPVITLPLSMEPRHFCQTSDGGQFFVSGAGADAVAVVFPYLTEIDQTMLAGHAPGAMTLAEGVGSPSYLIVANPDSATLTVINADTRKLVAIAQVGQGPCATLVTPDRQYILALNETSGDLAVLRVKSLSEERVWRQPSAPLFTMIPVGSRPVSAAVVALAV